MIEREPGEEEEDSGGEVGRGRTAVPCFSDDMVMRVV